MNTDMHRTARFRALGYDFTVETDDRALTAYVDRAYGSLAHAAPAPHVFRITNAPNRYELSLDDDVIVSSNDQTRPLAHLTFTVNRKAAETPDLAILHAAAAATDGRAVVLPAEMEAGKSTLVAGLVAAGLQYISDELVAIDPLALRIRAYPKPIALDRGSWPVLPQLEPAVDAAVARYLPDQWLVAPDSVGAVAIDARPVVFVFPRYEANATLNLDALSKADALVLAAGAALTLERDPDLTLTTLALVLKQCRCYQLVSSDLAAAVGAVTELLQSDPTPADEVDA